MALTVSKSKEAAPEYWRRRLLGDSVFKHRFNGIRAVVGAQMATRCCDTAVENELAINAVQQCLSRCGRAESPHFPAVLILENMHTRNRSGVIPQFTPCPILTHRSGGVEEHVSIDLDSAVSHNQRQFSDGGPRTRALRMGEHDQRRFTGNSSKASTLRPILGRRGQTTGSV